MNKNKFAVLLACVVCILPSVGVAAGIGSVIIKDVSLTQSENELQVAFSSHTGYGYKIRKATTHMRSQWARFL